LGFDIEWFGGKNAAATPAEVEDALRRGRKFCKPPCFVYVTSPDYYGRTCDIAAIAAVCAEYGVILAVDNAHGAYLAFADGNAPRHPIASGADICCDSAHKTLPVLTGGAYLHINEPVFAQRAKEHMRRFASSSPSYLILQSLDLCNLYLDGDFRADLARTIEKVDSLKEIAALSGAEAMRSEPLKIVLRGGFELAGKLRESGIEPELTDAAYVVLMFSNGNSDEDFETVGRFLKNERGGSL
jgi:arginine/lysine/ornithine decarboxylase